MHSKMASCKGVLGLYKIKAKNLSTIYYLYFNDEECHIINE